MPISNSHDSLEKYWSRSEQINPNTQHFDSILLRSCPYFFFQLICRFLIETELSSGTFWISIFCGLRFLSDSLKLIHQSFSTSLHFTLGSIGHMLEGVPDPGHVLATNVPITFIVPLRSATPGKSLNWIKNLLSFTSPFHSLCIHPGQVHDLWLATATGLNQVPGSEHHSADTVHAGRQ